VRILYLDVDCLRPDHLGTADETVGHEQDRNPMQRRLGRPALPTPWGSSVL
jgi:hypothetical protein